MKLLVHNLLSSKFLKGVTTGYPLKLVATQTQLTETDFDADAVKRVLPRVDWAALALAAASLPPPPVDGAASAGATAETLPSEQPEDCETDEALLRRVHRLLFDTEVVEGHLECPETGRRFPITNGIPNMLVNEDEVA